MEFIEVSYNEELKSLEKLLSGVKRSGDFFVSGVEELSMPRVDVEGVGTLSFPIRDDQIAEIIRQAERAPYGRGKETIVDTSVRKVWQVDPGKVRVGGKSWAANFENILSKVRRGLGCEGATVSAELYKLLVYDRAGFFLPHRDTEKNDGMFGTLVITLPSLHRGGELRIRHGEREVTVDTSGAEFSELSYAAFYADCEHEALPVRSGNRVCLVYNLIQKRGKGRSKTLQPPGYGREVAEAAIILDRSMRAPNAPAKLVWLLEHQYSPAGLSFSALKGADAAKAGVLIQAAGRAECGAHLGIVHIEEYGAAEPDYDDFIGSSRRYWDGDDEYEEDLEEETEDGEDAGFTAVTVDDGWRYIDDWRAPDDRPVAFGPIPLGDGELLPEGALDGAPPDKARLTEATGNEGASYERSYHRAALVLWARERYAEVLLEAGVAAALPYLKQLISAGSGVHREAVALAKRMVDEWPINSDRWETDLPQGSRPEPSHRIEMIDALRDLGAGDLLELFVEYSVIPTYDGSENAPLIAAVSALGGARAAGVLAALVSARLPIRPNACAELLVALGQHAPSCLPKVAAAAVAAIDRIGREDAKDEDHVDFGRDDEPWGSRCGPEFLVNSLQALRNSGMVPLSAAVAEKVTARPETFNPVTLVVPALSAIRSAWKRAAYAADPSVIRLWTGSAEFLLERSEVTPQPPSDWRQDVKLSCSCPDCRELQAFARNPAEQIHRFRVKKERRQHLHRAIDKHHLDMTHVTDRRGSPQTLVCTKDRRSFGRRMKEYAQEIAAMRALLDLAPNVDSAALLVSRMRTAIALAGDPGADLLSTRKAERRRRSH